MIGVTLLALATPATAQWQVGPVYPMNPWNYRYGYDYRFGYNYPAIPPNYDPFVFNWHSGRWNYVPIPYEPEPAGPNYNPYRFNWHTGRWDYLPIPPQSVQPYPYNRNYGPLPPLRSR